MATVIILSILRKHTEGSPWRASALVYAMNYMEQDPQHEGKREGTLSKVHLLPGTFLMI